MRLEENAENKKMQEALNRLKSPHPYFSYAAVRQSQKASSDCASARLTLSALSLLPAGVISESA